MENIQPNRKHNDTSISFLNVINAVGSIASVIALVIVIIQITIQPTAELNNPFYTRELIWRVIFCIISVFATSISILYYIIKIRRIIIRNIDIERKIKTIFGSTILFLLISGIFIDGIYCSITNLLWLSTPLTLLRQILDIFH